MFGPPNDILSRRPMPSQVLPTSEPSTAPPKLTDSRHPQWYVRVAQDGSIPQPRPLPDHMKLETWNVPSPVSTILKLIFSTLCMISYGRNDLQNVWDAAVEDGEVWMARVDRMAMRLNAITFVGGLLLGTIAAFLTTTPPLGAIVNYNLRGAYILLLAGFGLTLGGLIVGSTLLYTMPMCTGLWFRDTLMGSGSCVCCTLILITYPFLSIGSATVLGALGLLVAAWNSEDKVVKIGCTFLLLAPVSMAFLFIWTQRAGRSKKPLLNPGGSGEGIA